MMILEFLYKLHQIDLKIMLAISQAPALLGVRYIQKLPNDFDPFGCV